MPPSSRPPSPSGGAEPLPGLADLDSRVLVAGVVPTPRFGREGEVIATARAVAAAGADLVDVSLEPRLVGPAARAIEVPVSARVRSIDAAAVSARSGVRLVLLPANLLETGSVPPDVPGAALALVVDDVALVAEAVARAGAAGLPVAFDSTRLSGVDALAAESVAVTDGCRVLRTADVRRSRRVAEVLGALLSARRSGPVAGARR